MTDDPADIFNRTRALTGELSAAILAMSLKCGEFCIARRDREFNDFDGACERIGELLAQATKMQAALAKQIEREAWELEFKRRAAADVVDMRAVDIGRRG